MIPHLRVLVSKRDEKSGRLESHGYYDLSVLMQQSGEEAAASLAGGPLPIVLDAETLETYGRLHLQPGTSRPLHVALLGKLAQRLPSGIYEAVTHARHALDPVSWIPVSLPQWFSVDDKHQATQLQELPPAPAPFIPPPQAA